jgi:glycosyltransferase involved in cell wall biosynthesis
MIRLAHIITGLNTGGAEMMLFKLLSHMDRSSFDIVVISLTETGAVGDKIKELDLPVYSLGMGRSSPNPYYSFALARFLRSNRVELVQSWMYHADLLGGISAKLSGKIPVVWGIRHGNLDPAVNKRLTIWTAKICARLSGRLPTRIVCCSEVSKRYHSKLGYEAGRMIVIPNGFDLSKFKPDPDARESLRKELGIPSESPIIGLVARFNPQKDHNTFFTAASLFLSRIPDTHFVLCGKDISWENNQLVSGIESGKLRSQIHLLGLREDTSRITAAFDIATSSSSHGEGFPNTIGEAMACGVPCVVTDVGESAGIVGETGIVVPGKDPASLAEGWRKLVALDPTVRRKIGVEARKRIQERFSLPDIVGRYEALYRELI